MSWQAVQSNTANSSSVDIKLQQTYSWIDNLTSCQPIGGPNGHLTISNSSNTVYTNVSIKGECINYDIYLRFLTTKSKNSITSRSNSRIALVYQNCTYYGLKVDECAQACQNLPDAQFSTSIIAKASCSQTKIIKFSTEMLPLGITSTSSIIQLDSTTYSAIFTWIPSVDQIGIKQLYCTIAIDDDNRQSIQYCLNFIVIEKTNSPSNSESADNSLLLGLCLGLGIPLFLLITLTTARYGYRKFCQKKVSTCSNEFQSNSMNTTGTTFVSSVTKSLAPIDYESPLNSNSKLVQAYFRQVLAKKHENFVV